MKKAYLLHSIILTSISFFITNLAYADSALKIELKADSVVSNPKTGKISYVPVNSAKKGALIRYKATYTNIINKAVDDLDITLPIPVNMTFTGEASPSSAQASVDGINFANMPLMKKVKGKWVQVPLSEYKALRWHVKLLPAKKSADVSLNATVN